MKRAAFLVLKFDRQLLSTIINIYHATLINFELVQDFVRYRVDESFCRCTCSNIQSTFIQLLFSFERCIRVEPKTLMWNFRRVPTVINSHICLTASDFIYLYYDERKSLIVLSFYFQFQRTLQKTCLSLSTKNRERLL